ncbi:polyprenol phosphomannose-dependent alpha 1,6 mannosyltransferase MptB [Micromonospora sp. NBC_00898]|uniref:polyprenol phosphomannose-dependent alpha 1,6 mannosyltransferase MptB n=1 Tax=Micromonospora sp. NBC_00898 TaxID=2975981 RepID=UPI003869D178|nr:polyprenol phosphomannose-dependent alpha 1,6 mannosyltransferase MptB [Micromonospora sp. NBC_00898]
MRAIGKISAVCLADTCRRHAARVLRLPEVAAFRIVGIAGAAVLACAGLAAGALPVDQAHGGLWLAAWRHYPKPALLCGYFGLTLLVVAWWWSGRVIRREGGLDRRSLVTTLGLWSAPLLIGPPLFSRDVYSYLAQGSMVLADIDVYGFGVARLGGRLAAEVPAVWQQTPAPYGPVFLGLAALVAAVSGTKVVAGIVGLRVVALLGVGLLVVFLPRLARHCGVEPSAALWLGVLNPLVPLHLIAGAHNEAVMLGLSVAGLCLAYERRFAWATVLITLAALVKAPAAAGLLVVISLSATGSRWRRVSAALRTAGTAVLTTVAVTAATGTGYGWLTALRTPISKHSWSVTSALGRASGMALQAVGVDLGDAPMRFWLWSGVLAAVVSAAFAWWHRHRLGPAYALGLAMAAVALLGPATRPWYALWGLILIAAAAPEGLVRTIAAVGAMGLAFVTLPSGFGPDTSQILLATAGVLLGLVAVAYYQFLVTSTPALQGAPE